MSHENRMDIQNQPQVIIITGIMASGKSTVAELLAQRFSRSVHLHGDLFRRLIVNGRAPIRPGFPADGKPQLCLRYRLAAQAADGYAQAGFTVVVQDIIIGEFLSEFIDSVQSRPLALVVLAPQPEVVARREAERDKTGYGGGWTVDGLDKLFRSTTSHRGLWLDSSDQTPTETVDEIWGRLTEALI